ncbi:hypothetical protein HanIR_Chr17g0886051 [Helianthus annuus]|nr:hypothetical protein HanIR_Chr17g0886051 [Helianthus annuus]
MYSSLSLNTTKQPPSPPLPSHHPHHCHHHPHHCHHHRTTATSKHPPPPSHPHHECRPTATTIPLPLPPQQLCSHIN